MRLRQKTTGFVVAWALLLTSVTVLAAHAEYRVWTNDEGKTMTAEIVKADAYFVTLRRKADGKLIRMDVSSLSDVDQRYIDVYLNGVSDEIDVEFDPDAAATHPGAQQLPSTDDPFAAAAGDGGGEMSADDPFAASGDPSVPAPIPAEGSEEFPGLTAEETAEILGMGLAALAMGMVCVLVTLTPFILLSAATLRVAFQICGEKPPTFMRALAIRFYQSLCMSLASFGSLIFIVIVLKSMPTTFTLLGLLASVVIFMVWLSLWLFSHMTALSMGESFYVMVVDSILGGLIMSVPIGIIVALRDLGMQALS